MGAFQNHNGQGNESHESRSTSQCHEGNEKGSNEAPCHEGSSASQGHESNEESCHEAPCHEGSGCLSCQGHESDEESCHEAPCHEGSSASQGHEGDEVNVISSFCLGCGDVHACGASSPRLYWMC